MLYSRLQVLHQFSNQRPAHDVLPCLLRTCRGDPGDAAVLRRQASVPRRHRLLPDGRLLRDVLRGRPHGRARARADPHLAVEGRQRRRDSDVRRALPRRRRLHRPARPQGVPRRRLRAGRGSEESQRPRAARGGARRVARHADRCRISRGARAGISDGHRAGRRRAGPRGGAPRCLDRRVHDGRVSRRRRAAGARRRAGDPPAARDCRAGRVRGCGGARRRGAHQRPRDLRRRLDVRPGVGTADAARAVARAEPARVRPRGPARGGARGGRARPLSSRHAESRPRARPGSRLPCRRRLPARRRDDAAQPRGHRRRRRRAHGFAPPRNRSHDDVDGRPAAARVAAPAAGRARAHPGPARCGRGAGVPLDRARQAARDPQDDPRRRAAGRARLARHRRPARPRRAAAVDCGRAARPHAPQRAAGAARQKPRRRARRSAPSCATSSTARSSRSRRRSRATAA